MESERIGPLRLPSSEEGPAITTTGLTKRYGTLVAVDHLELRVERGEIFGLLGPNGAGKTTTILMLLGLTEPSEGDARVVGLDPVRQPIDVKRVTGYLPDNVGFYGDLTGRENLRYTARLNRLAPPEAERRIGELLVTAGLSDVADRDVSTYSRGMRQRLGIADALVKEPKVLILDEPTIGLDPEGALQTLALIRTLARERDVTVLLSSHLLHQVESICDRLAIFVSGRIVGQGSLDELTARLPQRDVEVEVSAPGGIDVQEVLGPMPASVRREGEGWVVAAQRDTREEIARAFLERGIPLLHLRRRGTDLDEVYRLYFEGTGS